MQRLLVHPTPKTDESIQSYLKRLASQHGVTKLDRFLEMLMPSCRGKILEVTPEMLRKVPGIKESHVKGLRLIKDARTEQPSYHYGKVALPSYHLLRKRWFCPDCLNEDKIYRASWQVAWLPLCTRHGRALMEEGAKELDIPEHILAANDTIRSEFIETQLILEARLERDTAVLPESQSVVQEVDRYLRRSLPKRAVNQLDDRRRQYSRRFFPLRGVDRWRFFECLQTQMVGVGSRSHALACSSNTLF